MLAERSRFFRVPPSAITLVRAIVEAHEGLAVVQSEADSGEIELLHPSSADEEVQALVDRLEQTLGIVEIAHREPPR